jgi:hypothetical protein
MATQVRFRRGNSTQNDAFTGAEGEITVDTTNKSVRVHDGLTAGGTLLLSNTSATLYLNNLTGNIIPAQNVTYSLGNSTHRFKDIFLSGSSIDLGGVILKNESGFFKIVDNSGNNVPIRVYTANVIESGDTTSGNVYFTNARVYSAVTGNLALKANVTDLTTSNVTEGTNLYFTNARARQAISIIGSGSYDNTTGVITITGGVSSVGGATGNVSNNQLALAISNSGILTTSNVAEGTNLYYTNARVYAAVTGNLATKANVTDLTTSNVTEGTNLYYSNYRVYTAVTGNLALKANVTDLTTSNVTEGTNLYYTNARTYANVISLLPTYTGNVGGNMVGTYTNTSIIAGTAEFIFDNAGNVTVPNAIRANILYANTIQNLSTSNLIEGTNLYYTNARVYSNVVSLVTTSFVNNLNVNANFNNLTNLPSPGITVQLQGDVSGSASANITNLSQSNTILLTTTIQPNSVALGTDTTGPYVANLIAGTGVSLSGLGNEGTTPTISIGQDVSPTASVTFGNVVVTGNLQVLGNLSQLNVALIAQSLIPT